MPRSRCSEPGEHVAKYRQLTFVARWFGLGLVVDRVMPVMFGRTFLTDPARVQERREWRDRMSGNHRLGITRATTGVITRQGIESEIDRIRVPALSLVGDEDVAVPPVHSQRLHERIAGSRLEIFPGSRGKTTEAALVRAYESSTILSCTTSSSDQVGLLFGEGQPSAVKPSPPAPGTWYLVYFYGSWDAPS